MQRFVPENLRGPLKIRCRNSRAAFDEQRSLLLGRMLPALAQDRQLVDCVDFMLRLFEEGDASDDYHDALVNRQQTLVRDIEKMEISAALLKRDNFETLVMRGVKIPLIDLETARTQVQIIDKICFALYGIAGGPSLGTVHTEALDCRTEEDIKRLIRRMTLF
jgi:hypothetical protein